MIETTLPLPPELWATVAAPEPAPLPDELATLRLENAALRAQKVVLQQRIRELEARLGQNSSNSSRPPSADPPQTSPRQKAPATGRQRGGQPGHRGTFRPLLPVEQVDEIVPVASERCRHCKQPFPATALLRRVRVWRHQVVELLPLAVRVTEYQMGVRRCAHCGRRTRACLPPAHLKRDFQALVDRGGEAAPIGRWGLAEIERLFVLWHRFRAGEFGREELRRRLLPLQARLGRLLRRGQENPDRKAVALCEELTKWWPAPWTFARVEGVDPTNNVSERALRPAVLWRKGSFGSDSAAGRWFAERLLTVAATCRQQGRPLLDCLVVAGDAALHGTAAPSLLPAPPEG